jgi:hypothetical protein
MLQLLEGSPPTLQASMMQKCLVVSAIYIAYRPTTYLCTSGPPPSLSQVRLLMLSVWRRLPFIFSKLYVKLYSCSAPSLPPCSAHWPAARLLPVHLDWA